VSQATAANLNATVVGTGTFAVQAAGSVAHDAVATSVNPVLGGFYASAAAPSDVSADGDAVRAWSLRNGSQVVNLAAGGTLITPTSTSLNTNVTNSSIAVTKSGTWDITNAGTFAVQDSQVIADDAGFTAGTSKVFPIGFVADEGSIDSVNEDDIGAPRM